MSGSAGRRGDHPKETYRRMGVSAFRHGYHLPRRLIGGWACRRVGAGITVDSDDL